MYIIIYVRFVCLSYIHTPPLYIWKICLALNSKRLIVQCHTNMYVSYSTDFCYPGYAYTHADPSPSQAKQNAKPNIK